MNRNYSEHNRSNKRVKLLKRILWSLVTLLGVLILLSILLLPTVSKNYLNKNGEQLVGRMIHIDKIKVNYFSSTVRVIGFQLFEENESDVFISFDTLMVDMKPLKLLSDEIYIQQLQLVNSDGKIIQNGDVFNFSDIMEFFESTPETEQELTNEQTVYKLNLHNIELKRGALSYTDKTIDHTVNMDNVSFVIPEIHWNRPDSSKADIQFNLPDGGQISSSLNYNVDVGSFNGWAQLYKINLDIVLPYVQQYFKVSEIDGKFSSKISFRGTSDNVEDFILSGNAQIDSLILLDELNRKVLGGDLFEVVLHSAEPLKQKVTIDLIRLEKPYVYFALIDSVSNFDKMLIVPSVTEEELKETISEDDFVDNPLEVGVNHLFINDGLIDFSDQRFREEFLYELSEVLVDMDTLEFNDNWVNIKANMKLNKRGNLEAKIGMHPFAILDSIQLNYVLTDFQLPDLNMYSKEYVGLPILFGDMYYVNNTSIVNKQIVSENELIIRNVEMGRKSGGIYDVPIKLALFILKDKNGDIVLDVPVTGDLSDPKTRLGPIVWNTLKGFMVKVVASPFKALGNMLGADPKDLEEITFDYADTALVAKQEKSLNLLLELEQEKPELQIDLQYFNDKKLERTDAARQISHEFFYRDKQKQASSNRKEYLEYLEDKTGQDSLVIQDYEMLFAPESIVDSVLEVNEKYRIENVRTYLIGKNDSTTIRLFGYNADEVLNIGSRPKFQIKYLLAEEVEH